MKRSNYIYDACGKLRTLIKQEAPLARRAQRIHRTCLVGILYDISREKIC